MKLRKIMLATALSVAVGGSILWAADHIDSPAVTNQSSDITDVYAFRGADANNLVFVANTQGLLSPSATGAAKFDANTLIEFNVDNNNDNVEDLVIQAIYDGSKMKFYGPVAPSEKGTRSRLEGSVTAEVAVTTYGSTAVTATGSNGIKVFAGPRDDPFFFDLDQYKKVIGGTATGFNNPGNDTFKGTNVLSIVVEVPKTLLGASTGKVNLWVETKKKI
ncbi:MAG: DUF4331 domain-containing protein [Sphingobacteriales bacterium]|nr:MAG: DUF4331 domain-containing protein [Sphingobacteriales bacterium]